jgi:hypothetical protein
VSVTFRPTADELALCRYAAKLQNARCVDRQAAQPHRNPRQMANVSPEQSWFVGIIGEYYASFVTGSPYDPFAPKPPPGAPDLAPDYQVRCGTGHWRELPIRRDDYLQCPQQRYVLVTFSETVIVHGWIVCKHGAERPEWLAPRGAFGSTPGNYVPQKCLAYHFGPDDMPFDWRERRRRRVAEVAQYLERKATQ